MTLSDERQSVDSSTTKTKKKRSKWKCWFSHDRVAGWLLNLTRNAIVKVVSYFVEINFVLTLFSTMVGNYNKYMQLHSKLNAIHSNYTIIITHHYT